MEYPLGHLLDGLNAPYNAGLNPSFNGIPSRAGLFIFLLRISYLGLNPSFNGIPSRAPRRNRNKIRNDVLILLLMEYPLGQNFLLI